MGTALHPDPAHCTIMASPSSDVIQAEHSASLDPESLPMGSNVASSQGQGPTGTVIVQEHALLTSHSCSHLEQVTAGGHSRPSLAQLCWLRGKSPPGWASLHLGLRRSDPAPTRTVGLGRRLPLLCLPQHAKAKANSPRSWAAHQQGSGWRGQLEHGSSATDTWKGGGRCVRNGHGPP